MSDSPSSSPPRAPDTLRTTDAPHPFNLPSADLILRTADLVDFRVHTLFLAMASPFFATMLALPQPAVDTAASVLLAGAESRATPVVPVSEDSATLELLLRLVYPISKPRTKMEDPQMILPALQAALKYEMGLPIDILSERLVAVIPKSPLQVWAAACRTGLEDVARQAADTLKASWTPQENKEVLTLLDDLEDMAGISAGDYYRLKRFLVGETVPALLSSPLSELDTTTMTSSSPFSTDIPGADVKCQPSSRHGSPTPFFAHQLMLSSHSSVLKTQILSRQATASSAFSSHDMEPIVIDFDEEADVVSDVLAVCYGGEDDLPTGLTRIAGLFAASRKYDMTRVARWTRRAWDAAAALRPLEAYFVALDHGLKECAEAASRHMLARPIADDYTPVMENATALSYHRLLEYYDACRQIVRERLVQASTRIPNHLSQHHTCTHSYDSYYGNYSGSSQNVTIPTTNITSALTDIANTTLPGEGLKKALRDAVIKAGPSPTVFDLPSFAAALVQCILSTPDEIEGALDIVKINLNT